MIEEYFYLLKESNKDVEIKLENIYPHYFSNAVVTWCKKDSKKPLLEIYQGTDDLDFKLVILHEISHILASYKHDSKFWDCACGLYKQYDIPYQYVVYRELYYKLRCKKYIEKHYEIKIPEVVLNVARQENKTKRKLMEYPEGLNRVKPKQIILNNKPTWVAEDYKNGLENERAV